MGNLVAPTPIDFPEGSVVPADAVQEQVDATRGSTLNGGVLPRSKLVNGRFVLDKSIFPDVVHEGTLWDVLKWRRNVISTVPRVWTI